MRKAFHQYFRRVACPSFAWAGPLIFSSPQTPSAHHHRPPTARRRQWRSTLWQDRGLPANKTALDPAQPHSCRHPRQPKSSTRGTTPGRVPAHQENEFCNNYSVISARLCLFNHNRHPALSITCNPTPRPKFRHFFARTYTSIRTITPAKCSTWNIVRTTWAARLKAVPFPNKTPAAGC